MPSPVPKRERRVFMVGAGLSCALGLPNTAALVAEVLRSYENDRTWRHGKNLGPEMEKAFAFFYPDGTNADFRPNAVDFFSTLKAYLETGAGFPGGLTDAPELYRKLKFAIARLLLERLRSRDAHLKAGHEYLDELVQPGHIAITSNWDVAIERYAKHKQIPVRFSGYDKGEFVLLKLHGSLDWTLGHALPRPDQDYALLNERITTGRPYKPKLPPKSKRRDVLVRIRALENWGSAWSFVSSRTHEPHMVTMARGKSGDLGPLDAVWRDAYAALTRASELEIVGYSMPDDDVEIRTLLRAGLERGSHNAQISVRNPAPDVHDRVRQFLDHHAESDYQAVDSL